MQLSLKNRNETYAEIFEKLPEARSLVLKTVYMLGEATQQKVADILEKPLNEISGRFTELCFYGFLKQTTSSISRRSNNKITVYAVTTTNERIDIINKHYQELVDKQKDLETDYHNGLSNYTIEVVRLQIFKIGKKIKELSKYC